LFTRDGAVAPVPLSGVSIDAEVFGFCARVSIAHRYVNREPVPIEATYLFPLDESAAVCGFEAVVDGTLVIGEVQEREKAFEAYDDAMGQGHGAFLLDEERPDVFQASVGNLPPGKEVLVRITYVTELGVEGRRLRFTIPTTVSPRYAPAEDRQGTGRPDSETLNPPVAWAVSYGLDLSVRLSLPGGITAVESPSHPISVALGDACATVSLTHARAALDRDFVLSVEAAGVDAPQAWIERGDGETEAIAVGFIPQFSPAQQSPTEIIFVVDRSGSMEGTSIDEVRKALQLCLRSMIPGCRFNVVGFGSTHRSLFPESRPYDQASLVEASAHVAALGADLGGTEILPALEFALLRPPAEGLARQIVVLTDGEVTNTDAVLTLARTHAGGARIFTLGIGAGASHHLVRGLARAGRGSAEFIYPGERIEPKVLRLFERLLSPVLGGVHLEWTGARVVQAPRDVPTVFAGSRLVVYAFTNGTRPSAVRLAAASPAGPVNYEISLRGVPIVEGRAVATLAARARIRELEEGGEWLTAGGSRQRERQRSGVRDEIVALSVRYGLISRETSFVAIERRDTPVIGDVQLRRVPVALTSGWGGLEERARGMLWSMPVASMPVASLMVSPAAFEYDQTPLSSDGATGPAWHLTEERALHEASATPGPSARRGRVPRRPEPPPGMDELVGLQRADGSWALDAPFAAAIGRSLTDLEAVLAGARGSADDVRRAWATALALAWLQIHAADVAVEWRMLGAKAQRWIDDVAAIPPGGWTWIDRAREFLDEHPP
jgi:Ca-activated chloride channel family protein